MDVLEARFFCPSLQMHPYRDRPVDPVAGFTKQLVHAVDVVSFLQRAVFRVVDQVKVLELDPASDFGLSGPKGLVLLCPALVLGMETHL